MSYLGGILDYPIGHIQPLTVSAGGGSSTTGSATFKYTSLTDPPAPEYTMSVDPSRFTLRPDDIGFTQSLDQPSKLIFRPADIGFTQDLDLPAKFTLFADIDFTQDVEEVRVTINDRPPQEDTYLDENVPDTTHGASTSLLAKTNAAVGNNEQITYIAWDTQFVTGSVTTATIDVEVSTSAVLGETASFDIYTHTAKPFEEDTATWNNTEQPSGTLRQTINQAVTTTPTIYTLTLDSTTRTNMVGNWVYIRLEGTGALGTSTITVTSKEGTNGPEMDMEAVLT